MYSQRGTICYPKSQHAISPSMKMWCVALLTSTTLLWLVVSLALQPSPLSPFCNGICLGCGECRTKFVPCNLAETCCTSPSSPRKKLNDILKRGPMMYRGRRLILRHWQYGLIHSFSSLKESRLGYNLMAFLKSRVLGERFAPLGRCERG